MDSKITMFFALLILVLLSAFFSATETAFTSLNRIRLRSRAEGGDKRAEKTLAIAQEYDKLLSTILIGNNIVNNVAATIAAVLFIDLFGTASGPAISAVVLTVVVLIFGEVSPKSLAKESPERVAMFATPLLRVFLFVLTPLNILFGQWKKLLSIIFHSKEDSTITEEELVTMVDQAHSEGGLDEQESDLIRAAIEFNDLEVSEILTPRVDLAAISFSETDEKIASIFAESGYSRLPVYKDSVDNIIGVVHEKDFYAARYRGVLSLEDITSPILYTTGTTKVSDLLRILQKSKAHMAVVVDEYGGTEGIATLEDILEELVGEIWDEHDEVIEEFQKQDDGSYLIACSANMDDLYDLFCLKGGQSDATTVSGWVMEMVGRVPEVGDHFVAEDMDVTVTRIEGRRVLEIRVLLLQDETKE